MKHDKIKLNKTKKMALIKLKQQLFYAIYDVRITTVI